MSSGRNAKQFLHEYLNPNDPDDLDNDREDDAEETEIGFKQWTMTNQTELTSMILPQNEFINLLVEKLENITTHSFIARCRASYLKQLKNMIGADEVIVLGDFAENYSFLVMIFRDTNGTRVSAHSTPCCCVHLFQ